jgi:hypothetical protein
MFGGAAAYGVNSTRDILAPHGLRPIPRPLIRRWQLDLQRQKVDYYPTDVSHRDEVGVHLLRVGQFDETIRKVKASHATIRGTADSRGSIWALAANPTTPGGWPSALSRKPGKAYPSARRATARTFSMS